MLHYISLSGRGQGSGWSQCGQVVGRHHGLNGNWASEASPTLGCSIEISRDIYICACVCRMSN